MEEPAEQMEENTLEIPTETAVAPRAATTVRRNERGEIIRWKARFVALGFLQHFGVDCFETYATVANMSSIRNFLSVCCAAGFVMERLDAATAYLNSDLEEDVYIETPEGLNDDSKCVLKLKKALYGLKQAGNTWFETIQRLLVGTGFKPCGGDTCVLVERVGNEFIYICLYVVVVAARTSELVDDVKRAIASRFRIKELGYVRHLLGMKIANDQKARTMTVAQTQCIKTIVNRFNQQGAQNVTNPCDQRLKLSMADAPQAADEKEEMSKKPYRSLIGCIHEKGINYRNLGKLHKPVVFCDADWGTKLDDRRSVSGMVVMVNGGPVMRWRGHDLGINLQKPTQVWEDNQSAIALAHNQGYHARTKHADIRHHYIRESINNKIIKLDYVETERQLADLLTKALATKRFQYLRDVMHIEARHDISTQQ
ncbi:hypothetical protein P43SY_011182 [Pythium insidiosum]|uniref:Reverse transcriptase Ty1/copia-type domain-containing protein n=1 Tax=Pythium insidiosum TaxID=114742 RepID=A0AAD5LRZ6_PYTIN|nr:hypothetical protein P43SY_011182 [Pythium insidiosum]